MRPLLSLVLMVKDEAQSIREVLAAALPHVDRVTILDTGSTDGTQDIAREACGSKSGLLVEEPFVDYATTRNRALEIDAAVSSPAVFQLMLSADEYLRNGEALRAHLEKYRDVVDFDVGGKLIERALVDCHWLRLTIDDTSILVPRVFRTGSPWRYKDDGCKVHEYPSHPDPHAFTAVVQGAFIHHVVADPERRLNTIVEKHIPLLQSALEENPYNERALVYLAQSYESLLPHVESYERTKYAMEMMGLYLRRLAIPTGTSTERAFIKRQYLDTARLTNVYTPSELLARTEQLFREDPRPETALLRATAAAGYCRPKTATVEQMARVYDYAVAAVRSAREYNVSDSAPASTSVLWKAHYLAAQAAVVLAEKSERHKALLPSAATDYREIARGHVRSGLEAGGDLEKFEHLKTIIDPPPASSDEQLTP